MCVVQCHVFIQDGGERSIMMAPAATSLITAEAVREIFGTFSILPISYLSLDSILYFVTPTEPAIQQRASMVTTEISQVPLSGVLELLKSAK